MKRKMLFETNRKFRLEPKKDMNSLFWFFGGIVFLFILAEFFSGSYDDYLRMQRRMFVVIMGIFAYRLITLDNSGQDYKEIINTLYTRTFDLKDNYMLVSILNVSLDFIILLILFWWIELKTVSLIRVPIGLVYVLSIGFSVIKGRKKYKE